MADSQHWRATLAEHRTAWLIASASLMLIGVAMFWPDLFDSPERDNRQVQSDQQTIPDKPTYSAAQAPVVKPTQRQPAAPVSASKPESAKPGYAARPLPRHDSVKAVQTPAVQAKDSTQHARPIQARPHPVQPKGTYYVQTGAFKDKARASRLAADINRRGWAATVVQKPGHLYAVWVGPKANRSLARTLQETLKQRLNLKGFIIQQKTS